MRKALCVIGAGVCFLLAIAAIFAGLDATHRNASLSAVASVGMFFILISGGGMLWDLRKQTWRQLWYRGY